MKYAVHVFRKLPDGSLRYLWSLNASSKRHGESLAKDLRHWYKDHDFGFKILALVKRVDGIKDFGFGRNGRSEQPALNSQALLTACCLSLRR